MTMRFAIKCFKCGKIREVNTSHYKTWSGKCFVCGKKLRLSNAKWPGVYENVRALKDDERVVYKEGGTCF